jgi:hypothetical protein
MSSIICVGRSAHFAFRSFSSLPVFSFPLAQALDGSIQNKAPPDFFVRFDFCWACPTKPNANFSTTLKTNKTGEARLCSTSLGGRSRGEMIRTSDPHVPNHRLGRDRRGALTPIPSRFRSEFHRGKPGIRLRVFHQEVFAVLVPDISFVSDLLEVKFKFSGFQFRIKLS